MRYAEFCAGVGGFRLGIEKSKMSAEPVYSNEIDNNCEKTYMQNFGTSFDSKDIFSLDSASLPDFDMLCAGFPCQPFSAAGKCLGFSDPRGTVFFKLIDIIKIKRPGIVFLENVPNLTTHDHGDTFRTILSSLSDLGYSVSYRILDSSYFGVPQSRLRVYIIGLLIGKYASYAWFQKYYQMMFPGKLIGIYSTELQNHMLYGLGIKPSDKYYGRNGQLAIVCSLLSLLPTHFQEICYKMFGEIKHFYRLGSSDGDNNYAIDWKNAGIVAVGWPIIGDLINYQSDDARTTMEVPKN